MAHPVVRMSPHVWCEGAAARCLALVERHAPRLMREGGGSTAAEKLNVGKPVTTAMRRNIVLRRREGADLNEIARETGYSYATVAKVCRCAGLRSRRAARRITHEQVREIIRRRALGDPAKAIAADLGLCVDSIYKYKTHE